MVSIPKTPGEVRALFRDGTLSSPTAGFCDGYVQANLIVLPKEYASEFAEFISKNPKPCPLLEAITGGSAPISRIVAPGSNIATDIPLYRVYKNGEVVEDCPDISSYWEEGMTAFLIGCSLTFEERLIANGIPLKHFEQHTRVPMYNTNIACQPTTHFHGNTVVSMRPIKKELVDLAVQITEPMDFAHGGPIHIGDPAVIGITDITHPDYGDPLVIGEGEVPVFWACGVTPQAVVMTAKPALAIAHSPGYMLITDLLSADL